MIPRLYDKTAQVFTNGGIGPLSEAISCTVVEELNKSFELELKYPANGKWINSLKNEYIIFAKPADGESPQPFRIYSIEKTINGIIDVKAEHLAYALTKAVTAPITGKMTVQGVISAINQNTHPATDILITTTISDATQRRIEWTEPRSTWACMLGAEDSIIHIFSDGYSGGEWKFDTWNATLMPARGSRKSYIIDYGRDLTGLDNTEDMTDVYTAVFPYWKDKDGNTQKLSDLGQYDDVYESDFVPLYVYPRIVPLDLSEFYDESLTDAELAAVMQEQSRINILDNYSFHVSENTRIEFVPLWMTGEYKDLPIQHIQLGDTIEVNYRKIGYGDYAKVVRTEYDTLKEMYISIDVGANREDFTQLIYKIAKRSK